MKFVALFLYSLVTAIGNTSGFTTSITNNNNGNSVLLNAKASKSDDDIMGTSSIRDDTAAKPFKSRRDALSFLTTRASLIVPLIATIASNPQSVLAGPEYLSEPSDEFKESERQRDEFRRAQIKIKLDFSKVLVRFTGQPDDENALKGDIDALRELVNKTGGLPLGIKKDDIVKIVRARKARGYWPTNVEISYQALIREIAYQQSPNTQKDL